MDSPSLGTAASGNTALAEPSPEEQALVARLRRTSELVTAQRLPEAESELLVAQGLSPRDLRVLKLLALVRFKLGRLAESRQVYREASEVAPDDPTIRLNLGLIALKLDSFAEAALEASKPRFACSPTIAGRGVTSAMPTPEMLRRPRPPPRSGGRASTSWRPRWSVLRRRPRTRRTARS